MSTTETSTSPPPTTMPNARDALYQFVQQRLTAATGLTLAEFITARRDPATEISYRRIATEIVNLTGIDISHEAVRRWYDKAVKDGQANQEAAVNKEIRESAADRAVREAMERAAAAAAEVDAAA